MVHPENNIRTYTCPACGKYQQFPFRNAIDLRKEPELLEQICTGEFNAFHCVECQETVSVPAYWFVMDRVNQVFVIVVPETSPGDRLFYLDWDHSLQNFQVSLRSSLSANYHFQICFGMEQLLQYLVFKEEFRRFRTDFKTFYRMVTVPPAFRNQHSHWPIRRLERLYRLAMMLPIENIMSEQEILSRLGSFINHLHDGIPETDFARHSLLIDMRKTGLLIEAAGPTLLQRNPEWTIQEVSGNQESGN